MIRWIKNRFSHHIQFRLTGYFILILLPLVLISLFAVERSRDILYNQAVHRTETALSSAMNHLDLVFQNVEEISTLIAGDPAMNALLNENGSDFSPQSIMAFSYILEQLSNSVSVNRYISQISVYHPASGMLISTHYGGKQLAGDAQKEWFVETARHNGTGISYVKSDYAVTDGVTFGQLTNTDSISLLRAMDLYNSDRQANLLVVSFSKNKLLNIIKTLLPSENSRIALSNEQGKCCLRLANHRPPSSGSGYDRHDGFLLFDLATDHGPAQKRAVSRDRSIAPVYLCYYRAEPDSCLHRILGRV